VEGWRRKTGDAVRVVGGEGRMDWRDGSEVGQEGPRRSPKGSEPGFQSAGLLVLGIEKKWEPGKGCGRWKGGLNLGEPRSERARKSFSSLRSRARGFPGWKWESHVFCDSVLFSLLQVTSDPVFPIPDIVTFFF
jgi:hypothetical protein